MKRLNPTVIFAIVAAFSFALFIYPTPYEYHSVNGFIGVRVNRFTGSMTRIFVKEEAQPRSQPIAVAKDKEPWRKDPAVPPGFVPSKQTWGDNDPIVSAPRSP